ncbi:MAG: hypothetical protein ABIO70_13790 [Pseudomonadota bacterium]
MAKYFQKDAAGAVLLTDEARALSVDTLHAAMKAAGYEVSRTTAWRAKRTGRFVPGYRAGSRTLAGDHVGWVKLTKAERQAGPSELSRRLGVDVTTARKAIVRGWFTVTARNRGRLGVPADRIRTGPPPAKAPPPLARVVPEVIRAAPDGRAITDLRPCEIAAIFGLSYAKAARARRRGEIRTRSWPLTRLKALAERLALAPAPAPECAPVPSEGPASEADPTPTPEAAQG